MAEEIRITKKLPRKGDDGYRIVSVRMKETLLERLDALSAKSNRSRNEADQSAAGIRGGYRKN